MDDGTGQGRLVLITGIMAAGKSTVAQRLAERLPRSAHLRGDSFRRAVVNGREDMTSDPSDEALAQLRLRYRLMAQAADTYVAAGFDTIAHDIVIGPMLSEVVELFSSPVEVVVLAPAPDVVERRERDRPKTGYRGYTPAQLDDDLRSGTPRIGLWIDSSAQTPDETVDALFR